MLLRKRLWLSTALLFGLANAQQVASRDLVGIKPEWKKYPADSQCDGIRGTGGGGIGGTSEGSTNALLEVIETNGYSFQRNDEIVVTARLTNTGKQVFLLPWQLNPFEFEPEEGAATQFRRLVLHLMASDSDEGQRRLFGFSDSVSLYSSTDEVAQLQLRPNESALIRFATKLNCNGPGCWPDKASKLKLQAYWRIEKETIDRTKRCFTSYTSESIQGGKSADFEIDIRKERN